MSRARRVDRAAARRLRVRAALIGRMACQGCKGLRRSAREHFHEYLADGRVRLDPRDPSTARHAPQCEHRDTTDPAIHRATLRVQDRVGDRWVECAGCECGWQVPYYAAESVG